MNRHSRVLPFPSGRGKDKPPSDPAIGRLTEGGTNSSKSTSATSSTTAGTAASSKSGTSGLSFPKGVVNASIIPKGVAKSGIKSVKGLVNSLNVSAKLSLPGRDKQESLSCAPSISAGVATSNGTPGRSQNGKVEAATGASIESNTNGHHHIRFKKKTSSVSPGETRPLPTNSNNIDSAWEGTPITDVRNLEEFVQCESSLDDTSRQDLPLPPDEEKQSEEAVEPSDDTCNRVEAVEGSNDSCTCTEDNGGDLCQFCKELNKQTNVGAFLTVVGKNKVHESVREDFKLRLLCPEDVPEVKALCSDWFPVEYPDSWYADITSDKRFHSLAAIINDQIVGLLVSEVKARARLHREDSTILSSAFPSITQVAYILSLGVVSTFRRLGIATALLTNLLNYLNTHEKLNVKAVYLHVLASNTNAISFYEKHSFRRHEYLPYYYAIRGTGKDGLSYVLYINGGQPPWTLLDYMKLVGAYISRMQPSSLPSAMASRTRNFLASRRSWLPTLPSLPSMPSMPSMPTVNLPSMNMNILQRLRGQAGAAPGSPQDPEVGLTAEEIAALQAGADDESRNRSWLPSVNYYSLLQRFGGQCYDSGEQPDFEDMEVHPQEPV